MIIKIVKILKKNLFLFFLLYSSVIAQVEDPENAQGIFLTVGVGPRFPIGQFSDQQTIGAGFDAMLSFTDNEFAPLFFYLNIGYQNHQGDYDYYKVSDHSSITTNLVAFHGGVRYFFEPIIDDMILLMPTLEGGITYAYIEKYHQYKLESGRNDKLQGLSQLGFHVGGGLSFFLMDVTANYNNFDGVYIYNCNYGEFSNLSTWNNGLDPFGAGSYPNSGLALNEVFNCNFNNLNSGNIDPIKNLKQTNNIILPGRVEPTQYLSKSSIYINSSRHESEIHRGDLGGSR